MNYLSKKFNSLAEGFMSTGIAPRSVGVAFLLGTLLLSVDKSTAYFFLSMPTVSYGVGMVLKGISKTLGVTKPMKSLSVK